MLVSPENTPSAAEGTAVQVVVATIAVSLDSSCKGSDHMDDAFATMGKTKQLRPLRDIDRDPPRLIFAE
jgi:hypothetical protein